MKASLRFLFLGLLLLAPLSTARAQGPSLSPIANMSVNAGGALDVNVIAIDADDRPITVTAALPPFATLNLPTAGAGVVVTSLTLAPSIAHVGDYSAAVTATAGGVSSVRVFQITVNAMGSDQAPIAIAPPLREVTVGSALSFVVTASDADGDAISSLSASGLPPGATFSPSGSNTAGTFDWTPAAGDAGEYDVLFTAANALSSTGVTHVRVANPPSLAIVPIDDVTIEGGTTASVPVHASGLPGALITLTAALPTFANLDPPGSGTGAVNTTVTLSPPTGSAGTYHASITATSNGTSVTELFDIIVTGAGGSDNHPPVVTAPATATVAIGSTLSFDVTAADSDGDHVDLFGSALPPGSGFVDHANNTGTFTWTPVTGQAGTYTASFTGLDNRGGSGSASTSITVTGDVPENRAPTLSAPPTIQVDEGAAVTFIVTATDLDGDHVTLSASAMPSGATFSDRGDNSAAFSWTPGSNQSGSYEVAFLGFDGRGGTGTASTLITVKEVSVGGGGEIPGKACLVGKKFKPHDKRTCFRLRPIDRSFDVRDVVLSGIRLRFNGQSITSLDAASIDLCCHKGRDDGDDDHDDDGDDDDGDKDGDKDRDDDQGDDDGDDGDDDDGDDDDIRVSNRVEHGGDRDDDGVQCGLSCNDRCHGNGWGHDHGHDGGDDPRDGETCDTLGVRVCFATDALLRLFSVAPLPCALLDAEILATHTSGAMIVARFDDRPQDHGDDDGDKDDGGDKDDDGGKDDDDGDGDKDDDDDGDKDGNEDGDKDGGKDREKDKDKDGDKDDGKGKSQHEALEPSVRPNPLNPNTELSFTTARPGTVRVAIYDMQGRLVKTLLNESRAAGQQTLPWDGSDEWNARVSSGVYFLLIQAPEGSVTRRVTVVK